MNKRIFTALGAVALLSGSMFAQTAIDAYTITPTQLRGSARFVSMGGAFTSLGGDLSALTQNPAGLALYRTSDMGLTFDISIRNYATKTDQGNNSQSNTKVYFDNFGYAGLANLNSTMRSFHWGIGYNRLATFDRKISGYNKPVAGSLSNYVAQVTQGVNSADLLESDDFDPYLDGTADWLSILAYNSFMINNDGSDERYVGLRNATTVGDALYDVHEWGHVDEYNIDFAGNVADVFFWGLGVGIVDMKYSRATLYSESMAGATVYDRATDALVSGNAGFNLENQKYVSGSGANLKIGVIVRPIEMLRLGLAVHTPTWLHVNHSGYAQTDFNYTPDGADKAHSGDYSTPDYGYSSRLNTPWRFMFGASVVLGSKAIVSADYERVAYSDMRIKRHNDGFMGGYVTDQVANDDIKTLFKAGNIFRVGLEYRLSRSVSARLGYNYQGSAVTQRAADGIAYVSTAGTDPGYSLYNDTNNFSVGLGYRYGGWYIDAAYQYTRQTGTYHAFTTDQANIAPSANITSTHNNIVISTGFRF